MTHRLLVNPGTPESWEIQLKSGTNRIGRGEDNDHQIGHPSISGAHCEIVVNDAGVRLKDLGSTNGTFVNRSPVQEAVLQTGQHVQLGNVDMIFESVGSAEAVSASPPRASGAPLRLNISRPQPAVETSPVKEEEPAGTPPIAPPIIQPIAAPGTVCKSHQKTPARFLCQKCRQYFCDLCVMTRATAGSSGKFCRACGSPVVTLQVSTTRTAEKGFFARLPGAFKYPLNGDGMILLISGALFFLLIDSMTYLARFGGLVAYGGGGMLAVFGTGYLVSYMRRIVADSANGEDRMPDWPEFTEWSDVSVPASQLALTTLLCFSPAIGFSVWVAHEGPEWAAWVILPAILFGCLYFPMAFLAVAMYDTVASINPLLIVPAIIKVPLQYLVACALLGVIVGIYWVSKFILNIVIPIPVLPMAISGFVNLFLLAVEMRILGLLYLTNKRKLGWFKR